MKVLSIVVPTYNMEMYLDRCLSSLLVGDKELDNLEILVINDGSKDKSSEIAHRYADKYPQTFIVVDKENGNYGSCVNKGIELATGKYFRILDADDWMDTPVLSQFIALLTTCDADIVATQYKTYFSETNVIVSSFDNGKEIGKQYLTTEKGLRPEKWLRMHQVTFKLQLLRDSGTRLQHGISYTDTEFCYFPSKRAKSVMFVDLCLYQYFAYREGSTISLGSRIKSLNDIEKVAVRLLEDYKESQDSENVHLLFQPVKCASEFLMQTALLDCEFSPEIKQYLNRITPYIKTDSRLKEYFMGIRYIKLWLRYRIPYRGSIMKLYHKVTK